MSQRKRASVKLIDTRDKPIDNGFRGFVIQITSAEGDSERELYAPAERLRAEERYEALVFAHTKPTPAPPAPMIQQSLFNDEAPIKKKSAKPKAKTPSTSTVQREARQALDSRVQLGNVTPDNAYPSQATAYPQITIYFNTPLYTPTLNLFVPGKRAVRTRIPITMEGDDYERCWYNAIAFLRQHVIGLRGNKVSPREAQWELLLLEMREAGEPIPDAATDPLYAIQRKRWWERVEIDETQ